MSNPQTTKYALFKDGKQVSKAHSSRYALEKIPPSYAIFLKREENSGGWWITVKRKQNGGELSIRSGTFPLWQQAFAEIWGKLL